MDLKCDGCLKPLSSEINYLMRIEFISTPDNFTLRKSSPQKNGLEIIRLLHQINNLSKEELEESVYLKLEYKICSSCQAKLKRYILLAAKIDDDILEKLEGVYYDC